MENLKHLLLRLERQKCRFVLVGGFSAVTWGSSMLTRDVDVACDMSRDNLLRIWEAVGDLHPIHRMTPARLPFTLEQAEQGKLQNLYLSTDLGQIDLLGDVLGVGGFDECLRNSVPILLGVVEIRVLALDALIVAKRAMGRPKDLHTVLELEVIRERMNVHL